LFFCSVVFLFAGCRNLDGISERFPSLSNNQGEITKASPYPQVSAQVRGVRPRPTQSASGTSPTADSREDKVAASLGSPTTEPAGVVLVNYQEKKNPASQVEPNKGAFRENKFGALGLSLESALAQGLTSNPDLVAVRGQVDVNRAMVGVAQTYPWNPFVQTQLRPSDGRGGQSNYYVWLMQRFELAHQRSFREQSAEATLNQVHWTIHQTELTNISQTARLYFAALYQRELYELANQTAELNDDLLGVVERRFKAGISTAAQVTTAKVAARQSRNQARLADATYQAALLALRQQLDLPASELFALADSLPAFFWQPATAFCNGASPSEEAIGLGLPELARELVEGRPDVLAALAGANAAGANYQLANAARIPDVQAGPIYDQNPNGSHDLGIRLQIDLPIWNNGMPLAR